MNQIINIIKALQGENSTNEKVAILKANKDNELLKKILYYTYNPYMKYKITEKSLDKMQIDDVIIKGIYIGDIFNLMDELNKNNINDYLRGRVQMFLQGKDKKLQDFYKMMLLKDLRCNISAKTINKVWKGLIPQFNVMLASKYWDSMDRVEGKEFIVTTKLDGSRMVAWKESGIFKAFTRQGQEVLGLAEIEEDFINIPDNIVLDGEILLRNDNDLESKDLYRATMKEVRKDGEKHSLIFNVFDILPLNEFQEGKSKLSCKDRKKILHNLLNGKDLKHIIEVKPLYVGKDTNKIIELLDNAITNGEEGVMVNLSDAVYECKRTKTILKVKKFNEADVKVIDMTEGTGKNKGKLGMITVQFEHKGKLWTTGIGSGFSDNERELYWNQPDILLNKIVTVGYFEISSNANGGYGFRFGTWKSIIRDDKDEISMY
ncbi:MAG: hypothetical protein ACRC1T_05515 [Clostridium chrysemydis]|uniref:ATP-dependent DNA ligase n=1 Tax=Clostridium chrysemydis TaxID=2665504 RepID=UPI003F40DCCC